MRAKRIFILLCLVSLSGCSFLMPYEDDFSCRLRDNYGKCVSVSGAYDEAVTGQERYPKLKKGETIETNTEFSGEGNVSGEGRLNGGKNNDYGVYRQKMYKELTDLIEAPATPMLRPPQTVRTLILPYSAYNQKERLYMPRYVYSIIEDPKWVMGEYLYKKPELVRDIVNGED